MATRDEIVSLIENAAARHGVSPDALLAIANIESSGNVSAKNPRSSASGLFQFVDSTARDYGLTGNKRNDPAAQADAAARMMATNARGLERTLGRAPNPGELYLAHQQGLAGARALLSNPNVSAVDALTGVYGSREKAQRAVTLNGGQANQTAASFAGKWVNKANQGVARIPPGSLPSVATQLDVRRRVEPSTPSVMSASLAAQRQLTAALNNGQMTRPGSEYASAYVATPQNSAQQAIATALANGQKTRPAADFNQGIFAVPPTQARAPQLTQPGQISNSVTGSQANQNPALAAALQQSIARQGMSKAPISYAGQERQPAPKVTTIGYVPTRPQVSGAVSYAGQERGSTPGRVATAADVAAVPYSQGKTIATLLPPIRPSQTPVNTSQPLTSAQRAAIAYVPPTKATAPANYNAVTSAQRAALSAVPAAAPKATPQGYNNVTAAQRNALSAVPAVRPAQVPPTAQQVSAGTGFRVNTPQGQPSTVMKDQARLQSGVYPGQNPLTQTGVGTSLSVRPPAITGFPTAAALRPTGVSYTGFPTPISQRPLGTVAGFPTPATQRPAVAPRAVLGYPTALAQRPPSNGAPAALQVTVRGAGTQRSTSSDRSSSGSSSPTYVSASTGRVLTPTVVDRYDPSTNTFSKVQTYR